MKSLLNTMLALALFAGSIVSAQESRPPNIIFIMADDMGIDWVSAYGSDHPTPRIDQLAEQGLLFKNVWCNPICTPTRLQLLTGMYPFRTGWTDHHDVPRWGGLGFNWDRFTCVARPLRAAGYATAIGGKWQVNDFREHPDALDRHGFDEHCVWTGYETGNAPPSDERYWNPYLLTNGERAIHEDDFGPDVINDFLIDFMQRNRERSFFVYYPLLLPHGPEVVTPANRDNPPGNRPGLYAGMVTHIDTLVGRIVDAIDELELANDTVLIFTCDNGSTFGGTRHGNRYPPGKGRVTNYGAQVPFLVRAPSILADQAGEECLDLIDFSDLYPTFLELAGADCPEELSLDGRSIVGLLDGSATPAEKRTWIYAQRGDGRMVRDHRYLLDNDGGFFDLVADPLQEHNLIESADAEWIEALGRLRSILASFPDNADPPFEGYRPSLPRRAGRGMVPGPTAQGVDNAGS